MNIYLSPQRCTAPQGTAFQLTNEPTNKLSERSDQLPSKNTTIFQLFVKFPVITELKNT